MSNQSLLSHLVGERISKIFIQLSKPKNVNSIRVEVKIQESIEPIDE